MRALIVVALALLPLCAGRGIGATETATSLEATVAELAISLPHAEGRQLQLALDDLKAKAQEHANNIKAKAQEHADNIKEKAPGILADVQTSWSEVSESAAAKAQEALDKSMDSTMDMAFSFLKLSDEVVKSLLAILFNVFFCLVMLIGAWKLPADVMCVLGLITFVVGPALVQIGLHFFGAAIHVAAWMPMLFITLIFFYTLVKSNIIQVGLRKLEWDFNGDGVVDLRDMVTLMQSSKAYKGLKECLSGKMPTFVKLDDMEQGLATFTSSKKPPADMEEMGLKIVDLESKIDVLLKKLVPDYSA